MTKPDKLRKILKKLIKQTTCATCGLKQFSEEVSQATTAINTLFEVDEGTESIVDIRIGDLIKWLKEIYERDKYHNAFAGNFRIGLIQQCNLYLEHLAHALKEEMR